MASDYDAADVLRLAVDRGPVFDAFREGGLTRADIQSALDVSHSTAHRVAKTLESHELIVRRSGVYELTPFGHVVAHEAERATNVIETADRLSPLLDTLADVEDGLELRKFSDGTVTEPESGDPYRPTRRFLAPIADTSRARELSPTAPEPSFQRALYERVQEGLRAELLYPPGAIDRLREKNERTLERVLAFENLGLRVSPSPSFRLLLTDQRIYIGGYNADISELQVVVDTDDPDAVAWATRYFEEEWRAATPYDEYRADG